MTDWAPPESEAGTTIHNVLLPVMKSLVPSAETAKFCGINVNVAGAAIAWQVTRSTVAKKPVLMCFSLTA